MRLQIKLLALTAVSFTAFAYAALTPHEELGTTQTTRQKIVTWVKEKSKDKAIDALKAKSIDFVMNHGEQWFGGPFKKGGGDYNRRGQLLN